MAKPYQKFRSVHKFEKKRKKTSVKRDHGLDSSRVAPAQDGVAVERDLSFEIPISAPASAATSDDFGDRRCGTGIDTAFLTSTDRVQQWKQNEDDLQPILTSASERKMRTLAMECEDSDPLASAATYVIADLSAVNRLLERTDMPWGRFD